MAAAKLESLLSESPDTLRDYLAGNKVPQFHLDGALQKCCYGGSSCDMMEILLEYGANSNYEDGFGGTVLHFAMQGGNEEMMIGLIRHGARYEHVHIDDKNFLLWACQKGHADLVQFLVEQMGSDLDASDSSGRYAVHIACYYGQLKIVEYLIKNGLCEVDMRDDNEWTPLHYACSDAGNNYKSIIQFLLNSGADIMLKTVEDKTALELAFNCGQIQYMMKALSLDSLLKLIMYVDDIFPPKSVGSSTMKSQKSSSVSPSREDVGSNVSRKTLITIGLWRKILQNDDVKLLKVLRDSRIWKSADSRKTFEQAQEFENANLADLFNSCHENGLGIYTYVSTTYRAEIDKNDFKSILKQLAGFNDCVSMTNGEFELIPSPHTSIILVAFLSGRLEIVELLLRMRQFDIVPTALLMCLIACGLAKERSFPPHGVETLNAFTSKLDNIVGDAVSRMYMTDKSPGKQNTLKTIDLPLPAYGNLSWLDLANKAHCTNFLTLQCSQLALDKRWFGKLANLPPILRWASMACPIIYVIYLLCHPKPERATDSNSGYIELTEQNGKQMDKTEYTYESETVRYRSPSKAISSIRHVFVAPSAKFFSGSVFHFIYLILFSSVVLWDFHFTPTRSEMLCTLFILSYAVEEFKQFCIIYWKQSIYSYVTDTKNWLDVTALLLSVIGLIIRCFRLGHHHTSEIEDAHEPGLYWARVFLLTGLLLFYVRILFILSLSSNLGPKLKMMGNMLMKDLLPMLLVFAIFVMGFGVLYQGLLFPNGFPVAAARHTPSVTLGLTYTRAIYSMFVAEYPLEELTCTGDKTCGNPVGQSLIMYFFHVLFIIIVDIMLINLLIALFSETVSRISECSKGHWLADRYNMIEEYGQRSIVPPPFNIIVIAIEAIVLLLSYSGCRRDRCFAFYNTPKRHPMKVLMPHLIFQTFALKNHRYELGQKSSSGGAHTHGGESTLGINDIRFKRLEDKLEDMTQKLNELLSAPKYSGGDEEVEEIIIPKKSRELQTNREKVKKNVGGNNPSIMDSFIERLEHMSASYE